MSCKIFAHFRKGDAKQSPVMLIYLPPEIIIHIASFACQVILPLRLTCRRLSILFNGPEISRLIHAHRRRTVVSFSYRALRFPELEGLKHPFTAMARSFFSHGSHPVSSFALIGHEGGEEKRQKHRLCSICHRKHWWYDTHNLCIYGRKNTLASSPAFFVRGICDACYIALLLSFFANTHNQNTGISRRWFALAHHSSETSFDHKLHQFCLRPAFYLVKCERRKRALRYICTNT